MKACKMPLGLHDWTRLKYGGNEQHRLPGPNPEGRRGFGFHLMRLAVLRNCSSCPGQSRWAILSNLNCRMTPAFGMMIGYRMPDRLYPLLLSWRGQGMSREERTSS